MLSKEERKAIERIEDFLTTNIIISISNDDTANSEELKAFISKNEYLAIEFIASMYLKHFKEIEELKEDNKKYHILFSKRKALENKYKEWIKENNILDTRFNLITFLEASDLLDVEKVEKFLEKE